MTPSAQLLADAELLAGFEDTTLPKEVFGHCEHVRTAWLFVRRDGMPAALSTFSAALKRYAAAKGVPGLYHETITWAYLLLIDQRLRQQPGDSWSAFASAHPDLLEWKPSVLDRYYSAATLWSDEARRGFVMPDPRQG
jgi:hypothetical protein